MEITLKKEMMLHGKSWLSHWSQKGLFEDFDAGMLGRTIERFHCRLRMCNILTNHWASDSDSGMYISTCKIINRDLLEQVPS